MFSGVFKSRRQSELDFFFEMRYGNVRISAACRVAFRERYSIMQRL